MAEQNGLVGDLTERMISATIENMMIWRMRNLALKASINLDAGTLQRIEFPDEIAAKMRAAGLETIPWFLKSPNGKC